MDCTISLEWFRSRRLEKGRYGRLQAMGRIRGLVGVGRSGRQEAAVRNKRLVGGKE
jgi:hypothetical protein